MCILNYINGVRPIEPNEKAIKFRVYLFSVFGIHLIFGFALMIFKSFFQGFGEMANSLVFLLYATMGFHFRPLLMYILINCFIQTIRLRDLGYFLQTGRQIGGENLKEFIPWVVLIVFYFIDTWLAFSAYREFKALYCE